MQLILYQIAIANLLGVVAYYGIIRTKNVPTKYLVGFGFIIPVALCLPFPLIEMLDIRALSLRLGLIAAPLTCTLKCLEAIYDVTPKYAMSSMTEFLQHFGFIQYPKIDPQTKQGIPVTVKSHFNCWLKYVKHALINGVIYSIFIPCSFQPFSPSRPDTDVYIATDMKQLLNNLLVAVMVSWSLVFSMNGVGCIIQLLGGFQTEDVVNNPIFGSISPSDFWGNRWNKLIHRGLKQGVYKPVWAETGSRNLATMATFLASGLAHEYTWAVMFYASSHEDEKYVAPFGKTMLFFGWNGILLVVEHWVGRNRWSAIVKPMPRILVSLLVVLTALPVGHLFTGDFRYGGYFDSLVTAWPMVVVKPL